MNQMTEWRYLFPLFNLPELVGLFTSMLVQEAGLIRSQTFCRTR